ncbi:unnamed protein product, partial [Didymodactylos carnosus]
MHLTFQQQQCFMLSDSINMSLRNINKKRFEFLIELLLNMPQTENAKQEMLEECRLYYKENRNGLELIDEFDQKYTSDKAIWWYTRSSFLYRLLNEVCRTENFDRMYAFRYFLVDMHRQMLKFHAASSLEKKVLTVYRGQLMAVEEIDELKRNINQEFSTNTYWSTSIDPAVAFSYIDSDGFNELESVIFQITIDTSLETKPYVFVGPLSDFKHEEEIIFSISTVFRVNSVGQNDDHSWVITLTLCSMVQNVLNISEQYPILELIGNVMLYNMNDYERAERYYRLAIEDAELDGVRLITIYKKLGKVCALKGEYSAALENYETAERICLNSFEYDPLLHAEILEEIASVYMTTSEYKTAIYTCRTLCEITRNYNPISLYITYDRLGEVYEKEGKFDQALSCYKEAKTVGKINYNRLLKKLGRHDDTAARIMLLFSIVIVLVPTFKSMLPKLTECQEQVLTIGWIITVEHALI